MPGDGWIAARLSSTTWDSFLEPIYAHTSPVYVATGVAAPERAKAAADFVRAIDRAMEWVRETGKYHTDAQRQEILALFGQGQSVYERLARPAISPLKQSLNDVDQACLRC